MTEESRFHSQEGEEILLFFKAPKPALRPTQPYVQWVTEALCLVLKRPGPEGDDSPPWGANGLHRNMCTFYLQALVGFCFRYSSYIYTADYISHNSNFVTLLAVYKYEMIYRQSSEVLQNRCEKLCYFLMKCLQFVVMFRSSRLCAEMYVLIAALLRLKFEA